MDRNKKNGVVFLDLDHCLFDTQTFIERLVAQMVDMSSIPIEEVRRHMNELCTPPELFQLSAFCERCGVSSESARDLSRWMKEECCKEEYLLPGVVSSVARMHQHANLVLLTYGDEQFQQRKWDALTPLHAYFHVVITGAETGKADLISALARRRNAQLFFGDDSVGHLGRAHELDLGDRLHLCRILWPQFNHALDPGDDHLWATAPSIRHFELMVEEQLFGPRESTKDDRWLVNGGDYDIRLAVTLDEFEAVRTFINERGQDLLQSGPLEPLPPDQLERMRDLRWTRVAMLYHGERLIGTAHLCFQQTLRRLLAHVEYVLVDGDYRGKGLGRALNLFLLEEAERDGASQIKLMSEPHRAGARALYRSLGYTLNEGSDRHFTRK